MSETQKAGFCALCKSRCGATYVIEDDQLVSAKPDPSHPTGAALCLKGKAAPEIIYSDARILHPMRRTTPKGSQDPGWEKISWEDALSEVASRLGEIRSDHGAEAVAFAIATASGTSISDGSEWINRFVRTFGSPNLINAIEICNWHKDHNHAYTFGEGILFPDYANTDAIILWGFNPSAVWLDQATQIAQARARGAKVLAVDPRKAGFAKNADHWLRVLPGTDGILANGLANLLLSSGRYDKDFVKNWTNGPFLVRSDNGKFLRVKDIDGSSDRNYVVVAKDGALQAYNSKAKLPQNLELCAVVEVQTKAGVCACKTAFQLYTENCALYHPARVAAETGVPLPELLAAAETFMEAESATYYMWTGTGQQSNASQTDRAIALLMALKGCYDAPGGNVAFGAHAVNDPKSLDLFPQGQLEKALGADEYPLGPQQHGWITIRDFHRGALGHDPYRLRALMSFGANMAVSHAGTEETLEALKALDFHVHCDSLENPTARFADIFLPVSTQWEREGLRVGFDVSQRANELIQLRQAMIAPRGEARSDIEIVFDLAVRLGLGDRFFDGDTDKALSNMLSTTGVTLQELRQKPKGISRPLTYLPQKYAEMIEGTPRGFATETGRVEVYSELFLRNGYDPLPKFTANIALDDPNGFVLTTAKSGYYTHSSYRHISSLRRRNPVPTVQLSGRAAQALALAENEMVLVQTDRGSIRMSLRINDDLHDKVAIAEFGWWKENTDLGLPGYDPFSSKGANYNRLVSIEDRDPISGACSMRWMNAKIKAAVKAQPLAWQGFRPGRIVALNRIAEDVMEVAIGVDDMARLPDYLPGQHILVRATLPEGHRVTRSYSLTGTARDRDRNVFQIAVRRVPAPVENDALPAGCMSSFINDAMDIHTAVEVRAPSGRFVMPLQSDNPVVLVAGGIGVTPFMAYLETLIGQNDMPRVHLIYANRNSKSHAFSERIDEFRKVLPRFTATNLYDAPLAKDVSGSVMDREGFLTIDDILLEEFNVPPMVYQCGPTPMMEMVETALAKAAHSPEMLFKEAFASQPKVQELPKGPFDVTFARSGKTLSWTASSGSILDLALSSGLELESGCRVGQCESCAQFILSGTVTYLTNLTFRDKGVCLTCQSVPTSNLVLDA